MKRRLASGASGAATSRVLACGDGWSVADVICTSGPQDRPFEEQHPQHTLAVVAAGLFRYRSHTGRHLMTPGSLMLGDAGQCYECGHEHGTGDRCVSFWYSPEYFERLVADAGVRGGVRGFRAARVSAVRALSPLIARTVSAVCASTDEGWEELGVSLAARAIQIVCGTPGGSASKRPVNAEAKVAQAVRLVERHPDRPLTLGALSRTAGLSPFHFLRTFVQLTGVTPHQYVRRQRLRDAATRVALEPGRILDIALDCGFNDVSTFNHAFRAEFGMSPSAYRRGRQT